MIEQDLRDYERACEDEANFDAAVAESWDRMTDMQTDVDSFVSQYCEESEHGYMLFWALRDQLKEIGYSRATAELLIWQGICAEGYALWDEQAQPSGDGEVASYLDAEKLLERVTDYVARAVEMRAKSFVQAVTVKEAA